MNKILKLAAKYSLFKGNPKRSAWIVAIGTRSDGAQVMSYNGSAKNVCPSVHAEARLCRKLDYGSIVYVARTRRCDGKISMARPCPTCMASLKNNGVKKVFYTISEYESGVIEF